MVTATRTLVIALVFAFVSATPLSAEWIPDGNPVCTEDEWQVYPQIASDGQGGIYICWEDHRVPDPDVYIQRLDAEGNIYWQINGIPICAMDGSQMRPRLASDQAGGVIVSWFDNRSGEFDIYAQRIDADGNRLWEEDGVPLCLASGDQQRPYLVSDGSGGAIVVWHDGRQATNCIYAQRIDPNGNALWGADGIAVLDAIFDDTIAITSDDDGGAIIAAHAYSDDTGTDISAQRLNPDGKRLWRKGGVAICSVVGDQFYARSAPDGSGGVLISWLDARDGKQDIYAQRIDYRGRRLWKRDGVAVCSTDNDKFWASIASDEAGGAYVSWHETRYYNDDIFMQHISVDGQLDWLDGGIAVCSAENTQEAPKLISDELGGAIVVWRDYRSSFGSDTYIQRVLSSGEMLWGHDGMPVCTAEGTQTHSRMIPDGGGGAYVCWYDTRTENQFDIYATWISPTGDTSLPGEMLASPSRDLSSSPSPPVALHQNHPNPFNPSTVIEYYLPRTGRVNLEIFDVSGAIITRLVDEMQDEGTYSVTWNGTNEYGRSVCSGVYFYRLQTGRDVITKKMLLMR